MKSPIQHGSKAMTVLVVDDSLTMRAHVVELIQSLFKDVVIIEGRDFASGLQAFSECQDIGAVVTDLNLDDGPSGLELLKAIHNLDGKRWTSLAKTIITQGGKLSPTEVVATQELGIVVLPKPTPETEAFFIERLREILTVGSQR
jgi:CheY-like chemotaxis protein